MGAAHRGSEPLVGHVEASVADDVHDAGHLELGADLLVDVGDDQPGIRVAQLHRIPTHDLHERRTGVREATQAEHHDRVTRARADIWTAEHLEQLTPQNLEAFNQANVGPSNTTIYMVGDINLEDAEKAVNKAFGKWKSKADPQRVAIGEALPPRARVILVDQPGSVQANIRAGHKIAPYKPEDFTELAVMNGVFGGSFEARINMNLREDKGWSYGMRSGIAQNTSGDMVLTVSGGVQIDKAAEAMQEILKEFQEIVSTRPGTPAEFDREILNRTRSIPGRYETSRGFLGSMVSADSNGLPMDYAEGQGERLAALTLEGVNARAEDTIQPDQITWVVVGDLSQMEEKIRALNFGEVEVWDHNGNKVR